MFMNLEIDTRGATKAITNFIKDYVKNAGKESVVIGLSGGLDSAVVAILSSMALGKEKIHSLFLPEMATPLENFDHNRLLIKKFGMNYETRDITPIIYSMREICLEKPDKVALGNIKARMRMVMLFEYANTKNSLVCGTSNKTELLIGYFTKYGDGGSDLMPMGDLYKTQVNQLARYLKIPDVIIEKPPSAGLWKGQTDEGELRIKYEKLDKILYGLEHEMPIEKIAREVMVNIKDVNRIRKMMRNTEHKRRLPPIPKLS